ncbi:MAG: hypothetical protein K8T25_09270 [Planctomycetia bacterium]|nr:hypothetical protein [Planctomycetia bacterium]
MGLIRFLVPRPDRLPPGAAARAYITGMDEIPWPSRIVASEDGLIVDRPPGESGSLFVPWNVEGHSEIVLSTASLMERPQPYILEIELARGTLNRLRNQVAAWDSAGIVVAGDLRKRLTDAVRLFSQAAVSKERPIEACRLAGQTLSQALNLMVALSDNYTQQALTLRKQNGTRLNTLLGADLGGGLLNEITARNFLATFNAGVIPFSWHDTEKTEGRYDWVRSDRQVEWCTSHSLKTCSGPLLKFDTTGVPDWLYLWEGDVEAISGFMTEFVRTTVTRYRGRVQVWQCAARINAGDILGLSAEQKLRLAVKALEIVRQIDSRTPAVVTFDQPWGESVSHLEMDLPLHLADALIRSNLGLAGIGLEINFGYHPRGTQPRDLVEFGRQLDRWSALGLPLLVSLTVPSRGGADALARLKSQPVPDDWTPELQERWMRHYMPVIMSKPAVQAIVWNQFRDDEQHDLAHGGLIDAQGRPKPALAQLAGLRKQHLL